MEFRRFTEPKRLGRRLLTAHLSLMLLLAGCIMEPSSQFVLPTASLRPYYSGTRSFFDGNLVSEGNNIPIIVECSPRYGRSSISVLDYSRSVAVLHNGEEMLMQDPPRSVATVVGDPETDVAVLAGIQSENSSSAFFIDPQVFVTETSSKRFRVGIFEANLYVDPYKDDASVENGLPGQLVEVCHK